MPCHPDRLYSCLFLGMFLLATALIYIENFETRKTSPLHQPTNPTVFTAPNHEIEHTSLSVSLWPPVLASQFGSDRLTGIRSLSVFFDLKDGDKPLRLTLVYEMFSHLSRRFHLHIKLLKGACPQKPSSHPQVLSICLSPMFNYSASFEHNRKSVPSGPNEMYRLTGSSSRSPVVIEFESHWGILRALSTLQQLFRTESAETSSESHTPDMLSKFKANNSISVIGFPFQVDDKPDLGYRGILVDVARNYYPMELLREIVNFMSFAKLNALHIHLTDDQGFMLEIDSVPGLAKPPVLNGPDCKVYSVAEMRGFIQYARIRGVRIVPEISFPGHSGAWTIDSNPEKDVVTYCPRVACERAWSLSLNPFFDRTYEVIEAVFRRR